VNVSAFEVRIGFEDFTLRTPRRKQAEERAHCDTQSTNTWAPSHYIGIVGDALKEVHRKRV